MLKGAARIISVFTEKLNELLNIAIVSIVRFCNSYEIEKKNC